MRIKKNVNWKIFKGRIKARFLFKFLSEAPKHHLYVHLHVQQEIVSKDFEQINNFVTLLEMAFLLTDCWQFICYSYFDCNHRL